MRATIQNSEYKVLPGTFVYINVFINDTYKFLMLPPEVIFSDQMGDYVYVVDANNTLQRKNIHKGYSTQYYTSVSKGLQDGERVVVSALMKLKEGIAVTTTDVTQTQGIQAILKRNHLVPKKR